MPLQNHQNSQNRRQGYPLKLSPPIFRHPELGRFFYLQLGLFCLQSWSLFLMENLLGQISFWLKFGLVFVAYGGSSVWFFYLRFPLVQKLDLVFFAYGCPTVSKNDEAQVKGAQL